MFLTFALTSLLATSVAGTLLVQLTNTQLGVTYVQARMPTDGSARDIRTHMSYDHISVLRDGVGIPEYHCDLFDPQFKHIITVGPGDTTIKPTRVGRITCGPQMPKGGSTAVTAVKQPTPRQSNAAGVNIDLTSRQLAQTVQLFNVPLNKSPVAVNSSLVVDSINVMFEGFGILEYHCQVVYTFIKPFVVVGPGKSDIIRGQVDHVICGQGLPGDEIPTSGDVSAGASVDDSPPVVSGNVEFVNEASGNTVTFPLVLGDKVPVRSNDTFSRATVTDLVSPINLFFGCEAFDKAGASLGKFFFNEKFIYVFRPGQVGSFLCD